MEMYCNVEGITSETELDDAEVGTEFKLCMGRVGPLVGSDRVAL